jgi:prepilin-type N-terminal cleavage/methylation domain-containing protein
LACKNSRYLSNGLSPTTIRKGFTLLEVLIVLSIIFILSYVGSASYQHYVIKAARVNAKVALLSTAAALERYQREYQTYANVNLSDLDITPMTEDGRYRIVLSQHSKAHYLIMAVPIGAQLMDERCATLMLNEKNEPMNSGTAPIEQCWLN